MSTNLIRVPYPAAGAGNPFGINDLELWLDASQETGFINGDEMSAVQDWSGNNRDGTGVVHNTLKPTYRATDGPNGLPCFRMINNSTGQGGYFTLPNFLTGFTAGHAFTILKLDIEPTLNSHSSPPLGDWGSSGLSEFYAFQADGIIYDGFGSTTRHTTANPPSLTAWHVYEQRSGPGHWSNYFNGVQLFTTATNTVGWSTGPKVGLRILATTSSLDGLIFGALFFSRILNSTEIQTVYDYIEDETTIVMP